MAEAVADPARRTARYSAEVKTLRQAAADFAHRPSPWVILGAFAILAGLRLAIGDLTWRDAVAAAGLLVIYPFGEWAIHVFILHMKPFNFRGKEHRTLASRAHGVHHKTPNDLDQLLLDPWQIAGLLLGIAPLVIGFFGGLVWLVFGSYPVEVLLTALAFDALLLLGYEWTHFLIHTSYVPKSKLYRSVWRNHRLHHFKNEHFWHGVTNNLSDRVLGTLKDHREVPRSETARNLEGDPTGAGV